MKEKYQMLLKLGMVEMVYELDLLHAPPPPEPALDKKLEVKK